MKKPRQIRAQEAADRALRKYPPDPQMPLRHGYFSWGWQAGYEAAIRDAKRAKAK